MWRLNILFMLIVIAVVIGACVKPVAPEKGQLLPEADISEETKTQVQTKEAWQDKWDRVLAAARKEGKLAVASMGGAKLRDGVIKAFTKRYGIEVDWVSAKGAQITQKVLTEQRAGLYYWDVFQGSATSPVVSLKPAGAFIPLEPTLIRPDILDPQYWLPGRPSWVDKDRLILNIEHSVSGHLGINTNMVKPGELKSLRDLLNPKWKGKIIMNDPTITGSGAKLVGVVAHQYGWDIWREIAGQEPMLTREDRLVIEWLAHGRYPVIISPDTDEMFEFIRTGAPVDFARLEEVRYATGHTISRLKNGPHPNAATVYINWVLSQEGQTAYLTGQAGWSARKDVILDSSPAKKPEPGVKYFDSNNEEFLLAQPQQMKMAEEIFGHLKR